MMIEFLLRFFYGAIVSSGAFLIGSMGRLAWREFREIGLRSALRSTYFWLAATVAADGAALAAICASRLVQSLRGIAAAPASSTWTWILVAGFALLLASKIGFNWAGTRAFKHAREIWVLFLASLGLWAVVLVVWTYAR